MIELMQGDCLEVMKEIPDGSVDMVLTDPPYGTTACKWDTVIDLPLMWEQLNRVIKHNGAIVMTASQPFTSVLVNSNIRFFKYEWIWEKAVGSNFATLKYQPMKEHESVLVFSNGKPNYYPIFQKRKGSGAERVKHKYNAVESKTGDVSGGLKNKERTGNYDTLRNPSSVQYFNNREKCSGLHPTQKPVALMEYLIRTYTNEGETVLDFAFGSGTTGVAAKNTGRKFVGIELDKEYFKIATRRIHEA